MNYLATCLVEKKCLKAVELRAISAYLRWRNEKGMGSSASIMRFSNQPRFMRRNSDAISSRTGFCKHCEKILKFEFTLLKW